MTTRNELVFNKVKIQTGADVTGTGSKFLTDNNPTLTGNLTLDSAPTAANHAVTKAYADALVNGLDLKESVRLATYGTNMDLSGFDMVDGVTPVDGDRVLVKDQTLPAENGIYIVHSGAWTRSSDADTSAEVTSGMFTFVEEGTNNADSGWALVTNNPITLGATGLSFTQFSGAGSLIAGDGMTQSGSTFDVVGTLNRIDVFPDNIDISLSYIGQTSITTLGPVSVGTWNADKIALAYGGTNNDNTTPYISTNFLAFDGTKLASTTFNETSFMATPTGTINVLSKFSSGGVTIEDSSITDDGTTVIMETTKILGKTDGLTEIGSTTRRFHAIYLDSIINFATGDNLSITEDGAMNTHVVPTAMPSLYLPMGGNVIIGEEIDNGYKFDVIGTSRGEFFISGDVVDLLDSVTLLSGDAILGALRPASLQLGQDAGVTLILGKTGSTIGGNFLTDTSPTAIDSVGDAVLVTYNAHMHIAAKLGDIKFRTTADYLEKMTLKNNGHLLLGQTLDVGSNILQVTGDSKFTGIVNVTSDLLTTGFTALAGGVANASSAVFINQPKTLMSGSSQHTLSAKGIFDGTLASSVNSIEVQSTIDGGSVTFAQGMLISSFTLIGGATLALQVGLDISSMTGATTNKAIRTGLGLVDFGDDLSVNGKGTFVKGLFANSNNDITTIGNIPVWLKYTHIEADFDSSMLVPLFMLPAGHVVHMIRTVIDTGFTGSSDNISVGTTLATEYTSVISAGISGNQELSTVNEIESASITVNAKANVSGIGSGGSVSFYVLVSRVNL